MTDIYSAAPSPAPVSMTAMVPWGQPPSVTISFRIVIESVGASSDTPFSSPESSSETAIISLSYSTISASDL